MIFKRISDKMSSKGNLIQRKDKRTNIVTFSAMTIFKQGEKIGERLANFLRCHRR